LFWDLKMTARTQCNSLQVATPLYRFIEDKKAERIKKW
jgi:hypothetical protein